MAPFRMSEVEECERQMCNMCIFGTNHGNVICFDTNQWDNYVGIGNKAAGVRARKALQDLKSLAQELRVAIQRCKTETAQLRLMEQGQ